MGSKVLGTTHQACFLSMTAQCKGEKSLASRTVSGQEQKKDVLNNEGLYLNMGVRS